MKQSIFNTPVTLMPHYKCDSSEQSTIPLGRALLSAKWRAQVEAVRAEKDPKRQQALKHKLPCFTPSGTFDPVSDAGLLAHSGYISIDIDAQDNTDVADFASLKDKISAVPYVLYCGLSCRGAGYVLIVPIADPAKHRDHFRALQEDFYKCGLVVDPSGINVSRKRFVSYDPDPYINTGAKVYSYALPEDYQPTPVRNFTDAETLAALDALTGQIESRKIDITSDGMPGSYERLWLRELAALANCMGEDGREYAHRISCYYPGYTHGETDEKFTSLLRSPMGKIQMGTLFYLARQALNAHDFDDL